MDLHTLLAEQGRALNAVVEIFEPPLFHAEDRRSAASHRSLPDIPIGVKDMIAIAGHRRGNGNLADMEHGLVEKNNAEIIDLLLTAGAQIVATTSLLEYAAGAQHPDIPETRNPLNPKLTAGGSSAGSAALVGAGILSLAVGTDTGGSIRIPAAYCGAVGFKPTSGSISLTGVTPLAPTYDHLGFIAQSVELIERAMIATSESYLAHLLTTVVSTGRIRIGIPRAIINDSRNDARIIERFHEIEIQLTAADYELVDIDTALLEQFRSAFIDVVLFEAWQIYGEQVVNDPEHFGAETLRLFQLGSTVSEEKYQLAINARADALAQLESFMTHIDLLMMPTVPYFAPETTPPIDSEIGAYESLYTEIFNVSGQPAITLPASCEPMVMGIQLVAGLGEDPKLLYLADQIAPLLK